MKKLKSPQGRVHWWDCMVPCRRLVFERRTWLHKGGRLLCRNIYSARKRCASILDIRVVHKVRRLGSENGQFRHNRALNT